MKTFEYRAAAADGSIVEGHLFATNEVALDRDLEERSLTLIKSTAVDSKRMLGAKVGLTKDDMMALTTQLATVCDRCSDAVLGIAATGAPCDQFFQ